MPREKMSKKSPKAKRETAAPAAPVRKSAPLRSFAIRGGIAAVALVLAIIGSLQAMQIVRGEVLLSEGAMRTRDFMSLRTAIADLERAYDANPADPEVARLLGNSKFRLENRLTESGTRGANLKELEEALQYLQEAVETHERPAEIRLVAGDAMNLATNVSLIQGDAERARLYSEISADQYFLYHQIVGRAWGDPREFFLAAIPRSMDAGRPHLVLRYWNEMQRYGQPFPSSELDGRLIVARASEQMGFFDEAIAHLRELALKFSEDRRPRRELVRLAAKINDYEPAIQFFQHLEQRGTLDDDEQILLGELLKLQQEQSPHSGWEQPAP